MNLGIANVRNSTWKRIKTQHIALAAAGALAVSTLIGGVAIREQTTAPDASSQQATHTVAAFDGGGNLARVIVYVVGSEAEAYDLRAAFSNDTLAAWAVSGTEDPILREIVVVDSPNDEAGLQILQGELQASGFTGAALVDLRR